ncbi:hypothetical protein BDM02DRAFT_3115234 [Thelephora ganbajun]|uniref:Uncharacterized protein n=1 Tax=Thelephora ganbajun TaxID=370292 RepID=A0ACB6ZGB3_THEGA|nr:hypothetical protein BDM02DRAFT_3115234 [Thelephora ganbajun]
MPRKIFEIDEILRPIARYVVDLGGSSAIALACCCKAFEEPVLSWYWEGQSLDKLSRVIPTEVLKRSGLNGPSHYTFTLFVSSRTSTFSISVYRDTPFDPNTMERDYLAGVVAALPTSLQELTLDVHHAGLGSDELKEEVLLMIRRCGQTLVYLKVDVELSTVTIQHIMRLPNLRTWEVYRSFLPAMLTPRSETTTYLPALRPLGLSATNVGSAFDGEDSASYPCAELPPLVALREIHVHLRRFQTPPRWLADSLTAITSAPGLSLIRFESSSLSDIALEGIEMWVLDNRWILIDRWLARLAEGRGQCPVLTVVLSVPTYGEPPRLGSFLSECKGAGVGIVVGPD